MASDLDGADYRVGDDVKHRHGMAAEIRDVCALPIRTYLHAARQVTGRDCFCGVGRCVDDYERTPGADIMWALSGLSVAVSGISLSTMVLVLRVAGSTAEIDRVSEWMA
jgi:hypothetical protein